MSRTRLVVYQANRRYVGFLNRINRPDQGVVAVRIRPDMRRDNWLHRDILAALGKRPDVTGTTQLTPLTEATTIAWLKAHRIHTLVVLDAGNASRRMLRATVDFADSADIALWLGAERHITAVIEEVIDDKQIRTVDQRTFDRTFARYMTERSAPDAGEQFPQEVPASSYPTFSDDVARYLSRYDARIVRNYHGSIYAYMGGQLAGSPDDDLIRRLARHTVSLATTRAQLVTAVRAFQQACVDTAGTHVSFNERRLLGDQSIIGRATARNPNTWQQLRAYRQPYRGATAAVHAAGIPLAGMSQIRLEDVADTHIRYDGGDRFLESGSEPFVQALAWERRLSGADEDDALFVAPDGRPYDIRRLADAIAVLRTELGVNLYGHELDRQPATDRQWAKKYISSITRLRSAA